MPTRVRSSILMLSRLSLVGASLTGLTVGLAQNAGASRPPPHIGYAYPAGAQRGTTVTVTLGGQNLGDISRLRLTGTGVEARVIHHERPPNQREINQLREEGEQLQKKRARGETLTAAEQKRAGELRQMLADRNNRRANPALAEWVTAELVVAADAPPGDRELRLLGAAGFSNPVAFNIGTLPETAETVTTVVRAPDQAGVRAGGQAARAPPRPLTVALPVVVNGQVLPGEIDRIRFTARAGEQLVVAVAARALSPFLADAVPGWFQATATLRDHEGRELAYDDDFGFRPDPVLSYRIPRDGEYLVEIKDAIYRGRQDFVYRATIGAVPFVTGVSPLGGSPGQPSTLALSGWNLAEAQTAFTPPEKRAGTFLLTVSNGGVPSNPVRFALDSLPAVNEDDRTQSSGQMLTLPGIVNGGISRSGERDTYTVDLDAGATVVAEIAARRLDSPLDSSLSLFDSAGRLVAANDDFDDKGDGLLTHQADSRLTLTVPAAGRYRLVVTDTQGRGGPTFAYRLHLRPPQADFALRVVPSAINLRAGASVPLTVYALRRDGFDGEIRLGLRNPPAGLFLSGARIPPGADSVQVTLTAQPNLGETVHSVEFGGLATIGGKAVARPALPADDMMQAFLYRHLVPAREQLIAVNGRGPWLRWQSAPPVKLTPGRSTRLVVAADAGPALGRLDLELINPPPGISIRECKTVRGRIELELACDAAAEPRPATGNLIFSVLAERRRPAGANATPPQLMTVGVLPALPYEITTTGG